MSDDSKMELLESDEKTETDAVYAMCNPKLLDEHYGFVKENLKNILHSPSFCCICLKAGNEWYYEMDFTYHNEGDSVDKIENIILVVFGNSIIDCLLTENICQCCIEEITNIYRYVTKVRNTARIMTSYIKQLDTQLDSIHSVRLSNKDRDFANTIIQLERQVYAIPLDKSCPDCKEIPCLHGDYLALYAGVKNKTKCLDCSLTYTKKEDLIQHVNMEHLKHHPFHCHICGESFLSKSQWQFHEDTCEDYIDSLENNSISLTNEDKIQTEMCKVCDKIFCSVTALKQHSKCHVKPKPFARECSICHEQLFSLESLNRHMNTHEYGERHHCTVCNKDFESRKCYQAHCNSWPHQRRANPHKKFHYQCENCDFTCPTPDAMENHRNVYHLKIKPYKCDMCDGAFTTKTHLKHHLARHEGTKLRKYQCYLCPLILTTLSGLKRHMMRRHDVGTWPHQCQECGKRYVSRNELQTHCASQHGTVKSHECPVCTRSFGTLQATRCHVRKYHVKERDLKEYLSEAGSGKLVDLFRDRRRPHIEGS